MMRDWRVAVAVLAALLVVGLFVSDWLVFAVVVVVVMVAIAYAIVALGRGQREWFGREDERRARRERGSGPLR
jgi:ABC-type multidrug transport system fused ATPase/permease subunit